MTNIAFWAATRLEDPKRILVWLEPDGSASLELLYEGEMFAVNPHETPDMVITAIQRRIT